MENKIHIKVSTNDQAASLVSGLNAVPYPCYLYNGKGNECVDAKSYLGVVYFMVMHQHDTYFWSGQDEIPECIAGLMVD